MQIMCFENLMQNLCGSLQVKPSDLSKSNMYAQTFEICWYLCANL